LQNSPQWFRDIVGAGYNTVRALIQGILETATELRQGWETIWGVITDVLQAAWERVSPVFEALQIVLTAIWTFGTETLMPFFKALATLLYESVKTAVMFVVGALIGLYTTIRDWVSPILTGLYTNIKLFILPIFTAVRDFLVNTLIPALKDLASEVRDGVGEAFTWFKDSVLTPVGNLFTEVKDGVGALVDKLPNVGDKFQEIKDKLDIVHPVLQTTKDIFNFIAEAIERTTTWLEKAIDALRRWQDQKTKGPSPDKDGPNDPDAGEPKPNGKQPQAKSPFPQVARVRDAWVALAQNLAAIQDVAASLAAGVDFAGMQRQLRAELTVVQRSMTAASTGAGGMVVNVYGGLNFPNVRGGRDVDGFTEALKRRTLEASMRGKT